MGWNVKLEDGTVVNLGKLPPSFFEAQADAEGVDYWAIYEQHPARSIARWRAFSEAAAKQFGVTIPPFESMDEFIDFTNENVTSGIDISEQPVVDGFPPTPGEAEIGGTSTSPGVIDGPQM